MAVERINWKKCERLEPKWRIYYVLRRLSRDRYLTPGEVEELSHKLRKRTGGNNQSIMFATGGPAGCNSFGMIHGRSPINLYDYDRDVFFEPEVRKLLSLKPKPNSIENELVLIEIIKRMEKWKIKTVLPE